MVSIRSIVERMRNVPFGNITLEAAEKSFILAKFLCFCHVANNYFCSIAQVYGPSMLPAINLAGDLVLVERISHRIGHVGRGDIVIVRSPEIPTKTITKRITGMEGDTVTFAVDPGQEDRWKTIVVPKGHVWVQGDNVFASHDSRNFGPVPYALIHSKALIRGMGLHSSFSWHLCMGCHSSQNTIFWWPRSMAQAHGIDHLVIPTRDYFFAASFGDICLAADFIHSDGINRLHRINKHRAMAFIHEIGSEA